MPKVVTIFVYSRKKEQDMHKTFNVSATSGRSFVAECRPIISGGIHTAPAASEAILGKRLVDGNSFDTMVTP